MSDLRKKFKTGSAVLGSCLLLGISTVTVAQTELQVENDGLTLGAFVSSSKDVLSTSIRVVGPNGFVFEDRIEDGALQWIPEGDLADGRYNWEVWTVTVEPGAPMREISAPQAPPAAVQSGQAADQINKGIERDQPAVEIPQLRSSRGLVGTERGRKYPVISKARPQCIRARDHGCSRLCYPIGSRAEFHRQRGHYQG